MSTKNEKKEIGSYDQVKDMGSVVLSGKKNKIFCLTIIGEIEGHTVLSEQTKTTKYEHVIPQLVAIEEDPEIKGLLIILNTVGGDVEAGLAIAGMKKPTVSLVLGGGHSIGVPLAVSADYSFIASSATMTVHPVRMNGFVIGVPQMLNHFQRMQERITDFVVKNSTVSKEKFTKLLMHTGDMVTDIGTVLDGKNAVECGIINSLGTLGEALDKLYEMIDLEV